MKSFLILVLVLTTLPSFAAEEKPVTQAEAAAVFSKAERVVMGVLQLKVNGLAFPNGTAPATREQVLKHFLAFYAAVESKFKFTPPPAKSAPNFIKFHDAKTKQIAEKLELLGFVDRYGPLVTSTGEGLLPDEFGDALGYFIARVAELTHMPSAKFSPYLTPG
ncbi:MAG: hypothetical protein ACHQ50_06455 [Fimbriimonadales bacterium]